LLGRELFRAPYNCPTTKDGGRTFHRSLCAHLPNHSVLHNTVCYQITVCYITQNTATWVTSRYTIRLNVHGIATKPAIRRQSHWPPSTYRYVNSLRSHIS